MPSPFLTAEWRHLAMANYEVDPSVLELLVPAGTELDFWNGKTFLSLVAFQFLNTRLMGVSIPFHRNFDEVNLRFYVRRKAADGWRRGVVFVKEFVPRFAIAWTARRLYNENYQSCRMSSSVTTPASDSSSTGTVEYRWRFGASENSVRAEFQGEPAVPIADSLDEFIAEHYWGYVRRRGGGTLEYSVVHPPWRVWKATSHEVRCAVQACYGSAFCVALNAPPTSVFVAEGSPVAVHHGSPLTDAS
jgi:uncharacterized protein YqjF (DUF2071 family)